MEKSAWQIGDYDQGTKPGKEDIPSPTVGKHMSLPLAGIATSGSEPRPTGKKHLISSTGSAQGLDSTAAKKAIEGRVISPRLPLAPSTSSQVSPASRRGRHLRGSKPSKEKAGKKMVVCPAKSRRKSKKWFSQKSNGVVSEASKKKAGKKMVLKSNGELHHDHHTTQVGTV